MSPPAPAARGGAPTRTAPPAVSGTAPLAVSGLRRSYGEFEALAGLDLQIEPGECVALIGHNGSGKTTAVRLIGGLLTPSAGRVAVCGASIHDAHESLAARAALSLVPDTPMLYSDLTVREHLELVVIAHGVRAEALDERIDSMLARLEVEARENAFPGQLSRGMRQKLQLACALIRPYRVLVLDEPVVGLDPSTQDVLRDLMREAKRDGAAILMTTHQLAFARGIADRAVLLADGAVVEEGPYDTVVDGEHVSRRGLEFSGAPGSESRHGRAPGGEDRHGRAPGGEERHGRAPGGEDRHGRAPGGEPSSERDLR